MKKPFIRQKQFSEQYSVRENSTSTQGLALGFLDRVSVFETMRAYHGKIFRLTDHLERLEDSCKSIAMPLPFTHQTLGAWLKESLKNCGLKDALLRLAVHWFDSVPEQARDFAHHKRLDDAGDTGRLVLFLRPFKSHPAEWYQEGVALKTAARRRFDFRAQDPQIKASQFVNGVLAVLDESGPAVHELLFFGPRGTVAEGTVSNVFIVKHKRLLTPAVSSGILKGVTRAVVIELARKKGFDVVETLLTRHELYTADECFMTNTSSEVLPVTSLDGRRIALGKLGPVTRALASEFKKVTP